MKGGSWRRNRLRRGKEKKRTEEIDHVFIAWRPKVCNRVLWGRCMEKRNLNGESSSSSSSRKKKKKKKKKKTYIK